jgi:hypothetical protein
MPPLPASYERARQALNWIGATAPSRSGLGSPQIARIMRASFRGGRVEPFGCHPPPMLRRLQFRHPPPRLGPAATSRVSAPLRPAARLRRFLPSAPRSPRAPVTGPARCELDVRPAARGRGARPYAGQRPRRRGGRKRRTQTRPCHAASCTIKMCERMARAVNIGRMRTPTR